ncbi:MAG: HEAT repeat domain-containing protein [Elusimicrobia bacterium]|nr:HEAT repeat domain-containing protein [Elusimicrobiota bacterium]
MASCGLLFSAVLTGVSFICSPSAYGADAQPSLKTLIENLRNASAPEDRRTAAEVLGDFRPTTEDDIAEIRRVWGNKAWDEDVFTLVSGVVQRIDKPELAEGLIPLLREDRTAIEKICQREDAGTDNREGFCRYAFVRSVIQTLEGLKVKKAVPILREYLEITELQYYVAQALAAIGESRAGEETRKTVDQSASVDLAGLGMAEILKIVRDLQDEHKKDKWHKLGEQLMYVQNPEAKPELRKLFSHENAFVRFKAAAAFTRSSDDRDSSAILEMAKNSDEDVRYVAVRAMEKGHAEQYPDVLIGLLINDPHYVVRLAAADALGRKKHFFAVPSLQTALSDRELRVRDRAFLALAILTGRKYDYQGKVDSMEKEADAILKRRNPDSH